MATGNGFTPTHRRMLRMLADGLRHTKEELFTCLYDDLSRIETVVQHVSTLRAKLRPMGEDIICEYWGRKYYYRHVRLLANPYRE